MPTIECSIEINAPQGKVFVSAQDYAMRSQWDTITETAVLLDGATSIKAGTRMRVKSGWWRFEIEFVQFKLPERATFLMSKGPFMFSEVGGAWIVETLDGQRSRLRYRCSFHTHWWTVPPLVDAWIKRKLTERTRKRLESLKLYCEQ